MRENSFSEHSMNAFEGEVSVVFQESSNTFQDLEG